ncbi:hypothetical protein [Streptomyces sp. NPDC047000]|uniref:hypothetical protein n=1 Tax=Streptomyces sp. NPDC047000 TaxID=3155474 RepID=UPI0033E96FEF
MSGPMALEPDGGDRNDTLSLRLADDRTRAFRRTGQDGDTLALRVAGPREDAVDLLAAELADRVGPAVHPYEVAALLESEGLTVEAIRERYGHPDLFSLAAALYERVPRSFPEPLRPADPWRPDPVRCALRGALFALPGLAYLLLGQLWQTGRHGTWALIVSGLVSWAWGQALGHRAGLRLAAGRHEAGRTLLLGAPLGAALATAAGAAFVREPGPVLFAAGQSVYLAAAGVLLVLHREWLLLAALGPVTAGAAALPWWQPGDPLRIALPLVSLCAAAGAAGWAVRALLTAAPVPEAARPSALRSLPYGVFGLAAGVLVLLEGRPHPWTVIALTVSMGPAEWLLYRFRGLSVAALRATATPRGFLLRTTAVLTLCLALYLAPLLPAALLTGAEPLPVLLLAATLWTALLLQAFGVAWPPALLCGLAAVAAVALSLRHSPPGPAALSLCCGAASAGLALCALRALGRPAAHG